MSETVSIIQLKAGEKGTVQEINGGHGMVRKLDALGIRQGTRVTKVSAQWMRGPVIIRIGNTDLAIGYGMAGKIMVRREAGD